MLFYDVYAAERINDNHDNKGWTEDQRCLPVYDKVDDECRSRDRDGGQDNRCFARDSLSHEIHIRHYTTEDLAGTMDVEISHVLAQDCLEIYISKDIYDIFARIVESDYGNIDHDKDSDG